jgi:hypothetical protein
MSSELRQVDTTPQDSENRQVDTTPLTGSIYPSEVQNLPLKQVKSTPRSEKDTIERHLSNTPKKEGFVNSADAEVDAPTPLDFLSESAKLRAVNLHVASSDYAKDAEEDETPTAKRPAVLTITKGHANNVPGSQFRTPFSGNPGADSDTDRRLDLDKSSATEGQVNGTHHSNLSHALNDSDDIHDGDGRGSQAGRRDDAPAEVAQQTDSIPPAIPPASLTGQAATGAPVATSSLSPSGVQRGAGKHTKDVTQAIEPKSDTKEIQRRINEHRGYALEEQVEIIRERKAVKTWCNLHTLEEYGLVMSGAKKDKYWGKQENYYRIGGLTLLKITPEILARQRAPLPMVANGNAAPQEADDDYSDFDIYKGNGKEERAALRALGEEMDARGELIW